MTSSSSRHGGRRYCPLVFTEQGIAMLSSVLRSPRAVQVNIAIMRAFVELRKLLATHRELARRLAELESRYDSQFRAVFEAIRQVIGEERKHRRRIGFSQPVAALEDPAREETPLGADPDRGGGLARQ